MLNWSPTSEAAEGRGRSEGSAAVILTLVGVDCPLQDGRGNAMACIYAIWTLGGDFCTIKRLCI